MSLSSSQPVGFIPTSKPEAARVFYEDTLGLRFEKDDQFAIVFRSGTALGVMIRIVRMPEFTPAAYTIFGWEVTGIEAVVDELAAKGVTFLRYGYFEQDERGIWRTSDGSSVAWFHDPDGNTLSISQHAGS